MTSENTNTYLTAISARRKEIIRIMSAKSTQQQNISQIKFITFSKMAFFRHGTFKARCVQQFT